MLGLDETPLGLKSSLLYQSPSTVNTERAFMAFGALSALPGPVPTLSRSSVLLRTSNRTSTPNAKAFNACASTLYRTHFAV